MDKENQKTQQQEQEKESPSYWEDLMQLRKEAVNDLLEQQALVNETVKQIQHLILKDTKLSIAIKGLINSFTDIAEKVRQNMNYHIQMDENNNIVDYKKGIIDQSTDDMYDYIKIASNYLNAKEQIAHLMASAYLEIFTLVKANDGTLVNQEDINKITDTYVESTVEMLDKMKGMFNEQEQSESSAEPAEESNKSDDK